MFRKIMFISIHLFFTNGLMGQEITAVLNRIHSDKDSLIVALTIKNETTTPFLLVCGVNDLSFDDYIPIMENYGSFEAEVEARKKNQTIDEYGDVRDTIKLVIPTTKKRFQVDHNEKKIDIFEDLSNLKSIYYNRNLSNKVPNPPDDSTLVRSFFLDVDLYKLIQKKNLVNEQGYCYFWEQTIILNPNETKIFNIDLSYLLLRKATYQIRFDFKTNDKLFKKETSFLKCMGFRRFRGRITSNAINLSSQ